MLFNNHFNLAGKHAFLSPSKASWLRYEDEKLDLVYRAHRADIRGTQLHAFAAMAIQLGQKMPETEQTLNAYVNDALGFRMKPEQTLYYSDNAFGSADAISFWDNVLRIHDLKTGTTPTSFDQLLIYAALFCLEYRHDPLKIRAILRIYQNDQVKELEADPIDVVQVMERIKTFDRRINDIRKEEFS